MKTYNSPKYGRTGAVAMTEGVDEHPDLAKDNIIVQPVQSVVIQKAGAGTCYVFEQFDGSVVAFYVEDVDAQA